MYFVLAINTTSYYIYIYAFIMPFMARSDQGSSTEMLAVSKYVTETRHLSRRAM